MPAFGVSKFWIDYVTVYPRAWGRSRAGPHPTQTVGRSGIEFESLMSRFRIQVSVETSVSCRALANAQRGLASLQFNSKPTHPPTLSVLPSRKLLASSLTRGPCCGPPRWRPVPTSRAGPQAGTRQTARHTLAPIRFLHIACSCSAVRMLRKLLHALTLRLAPHDRKRADGVGPAREHTFSAFDRLAKEGASSSPLSYAVTA